MKIEHSSFEQLRVYRLAEELAGQIWDAVANWQFFAKDTVGKQLVRAADSIGANIAEGVGRRSFIENRRFVRTARGSLNETRHWLRQAYKRDLLSRQIVDAIKPIMDELTLRLNAYLRSIGDLVERDQKSKDERRRPSSASNSDTKLRSTDHEQRTTDYEPPLRSENRRTGTK